MRSEGEYVGSSDSHLIATSEVAISAAVLMQGPRCRALSQTSDMYMKGVPQALFPQAKSNFKWAHCFFHSLR